MSPLCSLHLYGTYMCQSLPIYLYLSLSLSLSFSLSVIVLCQSHCPCICFSQCFKNISLSIHVSLCFLVSFFLSPKVSNAFSLCLNLFSWWLCQREKDVASWLVNEKGSVWDKRERQKWNRKTIIERGRGQRRRRTQTTKTNKQKGTRQAWELVKIQARQSRKTIEMITKDWSMGLSISKNTLRVPGMRPLVWESECEKKWWGIKG